MGTLPEEPSEFNPHSPLYECPGFIRVIRAIRGFFASLDSY